MKRSGSNTGVDVLWHSSSSSSSVEPLYWQQHSNVLLPGDDLKASTRRPSSHVTSACANTHRRQLENIHTSVCPQNCVVQREKWSGPGWKCPECLDQSSHQRSLHAPRSDSTRIKILLSVRDFFSNSEKKCTTLIMRYIFNWLAVEDQRRTDPAGHIPCCASHPLQ